MKHQHGNPTTLISLRKRLLQYPADNYYQLRVTTWLRVSNIRIPDLMQYTTSLPVTLRYNYRALRLNLSSWILNIMSFSSERPPGRVIILRLTDFLQYTALPALTPPRPSLMSRT